MIGDKLVANPDRPHLASMCASHAPEAAVAVTLLTCRKKPTT